MGEVRTRAVPQNWPAGAFDLILFSDVPYDRGIEGLQDIARRTAACLMPGDMVVLINGRGDAGRGGHGEGRGRAVHRRDAGFDANGTGASGE